MSRSRAADDFETIRARIEELRRERLPGERASAERASAERASAERASTEAEAVLAGHRGPCACGLSLFPDECDGSCKAL